MPYRIKYKGAEAGIIILLLWLAILLGLVATQYQLQSDSDHFNDCLQRHAIILVGHTNSSNDAIRAFITDASRISVMSARLQHQGVSQNSPQLAELRLRYAADIRRLKQELHDSKPPACN